MMRVCARAAVVGRRPITLGSRGISSMEGWGDIKKVTTNALIHELVTTQVTFANTLVPWFLDNMPPPYFRLVDEKTRLGHLKAMSTMGDGAADGLSVRSVSESGETTVTFVNPGAADTGNDALVRRLDNAILTSEGELQKVMLFTSLDSRYSLQMFQFGTQGSLLQGRHDEDLTRPLTTYIDSLKAGKFEHSAVRHVPPDAPYLEPESVKQFTSMCSPTFMRTDPRRLCLHMALYEQVRGTDDVAVDIEPSDAITDDVGEVVPCSWITASLSNVLPSTALKLITTLIVLSGSQLRIVRTHLNVLDGQRTTASPDDTEKVTSVALLVKNGDVSPEQFAQLARDIKRVKWLDDADLSLAMEDRGNVGLVRAEVIRTLCALVQQPLSKESYWTFSRTNIDAIMSTARYRQHALNIADVFLDRFRPSNPLTDEQLDERSTQLMEHVSLEVADVAAYRLLEKMVRSIPQMYRTNLFMPNRYALAIRVDPQMLVSPGDDRPLPLGVFFVHGRRFNGFHVRFRDVSRGGMRLVTPRSPEQLAIETARHYDENYGLAFAQQLKNKDIPEGGSKAVVLINSPGLTADFKQFAMRKAVKAFSDSLLDLTVQSEDTEAYIVDRWGKPEVLYLGPDEQVIPEDIDWIIKRASERGLVNPTAFMSSKAATGINHKDYGVTSEGVVVFLDVALRQFGIDPDNQPFTVKLTGGPDGDVAGNCIKILHRDYGDNARVVGLADGSGCIEDPDGLDMDELLRLVRISEPVSSYDQSKFGPEGVMHSAETDEGVRLRNTMHNRVKSDAFIPAGGRPETINSTNWRQFMDHNNEPSSRLVVEGANLFITPEARQLLFEVGGVQIVKDSSANKCGVICSSYEIIASMLTSPEEFTAIKDELVHDVLVKLRKFARLEAELLFKEFQTSPGALPSFSERISRAMNLVADNLAAALGELPDDEYAKLVPIFHDHIPAKLKTLYSDRIGARIPPAYVHNAIANCLASRIVYQEGIRYVETLNPDTIATTALSYLKASKDVQGLIHELDTSDGNLDQMSKDKIVRILLAGGARSSLNVRVDS